MKKFVCGMLKLMAVLAVVGAAVYAVVAYWDKLTELWERIQPRLAELKASYHKPSEFEDYQDWEQ